MARLESLSDSTSTMILLLYRAVMVAMVRVVPLAECVARTKKKDQEAGNFKGLCELDDEAAERITFLH
jgi:hypothetical protein